MASAYSTEQIDRYLDYISIPQAYRRAANPRRNLDFLTILHVHQISTIPYENLSLHYSVDHNICLDPQHLYTKLTQNGRGGYCMENGIFFNHILRGLGFEVYPTGGRVRPRVNGIPTGDYLGWVHMVNIVTLEDGARYMVDISFGGDGAVKPLPLVEGVVSQNIGPQELRLLRDILPGQSQISQKVWIYQYRNGADREWNSFYSFPELEFTHNDLEVMNFFISKSTTGSFQTWTVLVVKFLREEGRIVGKLMLVNGDVKLNQGGRTVLLQSCKSENERLATLRDIFGMTLTSEEAEGIKGRSTELVEV